MGTVYLISLILSTFYTPMLPNHIYDLCLQLVEDHKALWRIKNNYLTDSQNSPDLVAFWERMEKDKEEHIAEITKLLKEEWSK